MATSWTKPFAPYKFIALNADRYFAAAALKRCTHFRMSGASLFHGSKLPVHCAKKQ